MGTKCEIDKSTLNCVTGICKNNGQCHEGTSSYKYGYYCDCQSGFSGYNCEIKKDKTKCLQGKYGTYCDIECKEEDSCAGHYKCNITGEKACIGNFKDTKTSCVTAIDTKINCPTGAADNCGTNGLHCFNKQCCCKPGFRGILCTDKDNCVPNPCLNKGTCSNVGTSYKCACTTGFTGLTCKIAAFDPKSWYCLKIGQYVDYLRRENDITAEIKASLLGEYSATNLCILPHQLQVLELRFLIFIFYQVLNTLKLNEYHQSYPSEANQVLVLCT
jgi:hypothetical protein